MNGRYKIPMLVSSLVLAVMIAVPVSANAAGLFDREEGLGDLFLLNKLFSKSGNSGILSNGSNASLGDLFILDRLFPIETAAAPAPVAQTPSIPAQLSGRILIQTENNGEAWYVNPTNRKRVYLNGPNTAFQKMADSSLGISNADFNEFQIDVPNNMRGRFIIKTEDGGKLYYINPTNEDLMYVGSPADAHNLIRQVGLGVSNSNLAKIQVMN